jgi:hypothetical protein
MKLKFNLHNLLDDVLKFCIVFVVLCAAICSALFTVNSWLNVCDRVIGHNQFCARSK